MQSASLDHSARQHRTGLAGVEAVSISSNRRFPRHAHDNYGIGLFDRGAHRSWSSFGEVESQAGDVVAINPEEMHDGVPLANAPRSWRMVYFDRGLVANYVNEESTRRLEFARPIFRNADLRAKLECAFALLISERSPALAVDEAIARLLLTIRDHYSAHWAKSPRAAPAVSRARQLIDDAPSATFSLERLATAAGVSRFQLIRGFAREIGVTPYAYQLQRRVGLTRRHIAEGRPLAEAADIAGFADQSHMTRAFVRQLGVTPARYQCALDLRPDHACNIVQDK